MDGPLGKFLEALGSGIGTGSIFCLSFSLSNRVSKLDHGKLFSLCNRLPSCLPRTQGLIEILGFMVIFDENQGVSDLSKYEFLCPIHVKIIKFLVI